MDLERLKEFTLIAEEKSFKTAAERMNLAPNVLSTRFSDFEKKLGVKLIERNAHHFGLTGRGKILFRHAKELLESYENLCVSMQRIQGNTFRSLRLMLCAQTMASELGPFLDRYCRNYPKMFLGLYDDNTCTIREGLQTGTIDIAFAVGRRHDFEDIPGKMIVGEFPEMKVHVPNDHRLAKARSIHFSDLNGETVILYPKMKESFTRDLQLSMLKQSGIDFRIYEEDSSPFFFDMLVPIGKGIRLWNWTDRMAPNTTLLTIDDPGYETCMFLLYNPQTENEAALHFIRAFLAFRGGRR